MIKIRKRDNRVEPIQKEKIFKALKGATNGKSSIYNTAILQKLSSDIISSIVDKYDYDIMKEILIDVDTVHDEVISGIKKYAEEQESQINKDLFFKLANNYISYRQDRDKARMKNTALMKTVSEMGISTNRDNANVGNNFSSKLLRIASETNKVAMLAEMPKEYSRAHEVGDLHDHDLDSYNLALNCLHIPTRKMLLSGFNTGYGWINPPKRIGTAAELLCILIQSVQNRWFLQRVISGR